MKKLLSILKFLIGWPLSLVALFFIGKILVKNGLRPELFLQINWALLILSILCFLIYFFMRSYFWQQLIKEKKISLSFKETAKIWGLSELKRYIPGTIWSFFARTSAYTDRNHEAKTIASSLLLEAEFIIFAGILLSLFSANFIIFGFTSFPLQKFAPLLWIAGAAVTIGALIWSRNIVKKGNTSFLAHFFPLFSYKKTSSLLAIMSIAFFFFGLGTYFSIASLVYLYPPHLLSLSGFFVVSFLVGYLSFITPMGLGVREAFTTAGLSKYMTLDLAALGSVFSRIILIFSELLFISLVILWEKSKKKTKKIERFIYTYRYEIFLSIAVTTYVIYFVTASFLRYNNFFTGRFDLGNMDQTVWNTMRGRFFQLTNPDGLNIVSRLSFHADYMLVLLVPFYYIWQDPKMLLLIQTVVVSLGGIFVFLIGQQLFKNKYVSFIFAILFLINPSVNNTNLYDFHAVTLATTLLLGAWYCIQKNKLYFAALFLFLAGTTKEEMWLTTGLIGIFLLFRKRSFLGAVVAGVSFAVFYYLFWHAIPQARGGSHFALTYYSDFGTSNWEVIKTLILSPWKIITTIATNGSIKFLLQIFSPLGFLSFVSPFFLLFASGDFAISLLSKNSQLHSIGYQYTASLTPFIFLSGMYGFVFLANRIKKIKITFLASVVLCIGILCAYLFGPLPGSLSFNHDMFTHQLSYSADIDTFLNSIPRKYSVAATNNVGSHLSHRQHIFTIPNGVDQADIIVMLVNDQYAQPSLKAQKDLADKLKNDPLYIKVFELQDFIVFKKREIPDLFRRPQRGLFPIFKGN